MECSTPTNFGSYLKDKRIEKGLNIVQLSETSGMSAAQISRIENGKRGVPKPENIKSLALALEVPYEELMRQAGYL
ncbi:helix-turn-helix domain-containing protein [Paenibacillus ehimensis]|uniref:helix-turn-helix domain-containing protein n=1 Tax=Paenibacillus ehimensis TaxID=79264 RepID=UPI00047175BB|nr:helix-turn-helix transcriptional regulator [Paenibacillus ehimensis]